MVVRLILFSCVIALNFNASGTHIHKFIHPTRRTHDTRRKFKRHDGNDEISGAKINSLKRNDIYLTKLSTKLRY